MYQIRQLFLNLTCCSRPFALQIGFSTASQQPATSSTGSGGMIDALDQFPCSPSAFGVRRPPLPRVFVDFWEIEATAASSAISFWQRGRERGHLPANATGSCWNAAIK